MRVILSSLDMGVVKFAMVRLGSSIVQMGISKIRG